MLPGTNRRGKAKTGDGTPRQTNDSRMQMTPKCAPRRNSNGSPTLSHKAHSSLHQSAAWSATQTQPRAHKPLPSLGKALLCPDSHTGNSEPKVSLASLVMPAGVGRRQSFSSPAFGGCTGSCACFPCSGHAGTR